MMTKKEILELLDRYDKGLCTPEEQLQVDNWYLEQARQNQAYTDPEDLDAVKQRIYNRLVKRKTSYKSYGIAAAVVVFLGFASLAYFLKDYKQKSLTASIINDVAPGRNNAIIKLADGKIIHLDELAVGEKRAAGMMVIEKTGDGTVKYTKNADNQNIGANSELNVITTPKGGQYQLILPDGTNVWLNAASELSYPISFKGMKERKVTLSGEAYFEVAKDVLHTFKVYNHEQIVSVTGTHFNVCCFSHEPTITTLSEGSVNVFQLSSKQTQSLKPGQQSSLDQTGINVRTVNPADFTAWKDGNFVFNQTPIRLALQQISRWYDVEFDVNNLPEKTLNGEISRQVKLSEMLGTIEKVSGVKFTITGRRIMVK